MTTDDSSSKLLPGEDLPGYGLGYRHIQVALIFSMVVVMYTINMTTPVVVVAITDPHTSPNPAIPSYPNWNDQSLILISFYWGYAPTQLLGGPLSRRFGTKRFMVGLMLMASLISICIPSMIIAFGSVALMACYFAIGLCQGTIIPMLSDFISKWAPIPEVTTIGTWIFASRSLGSVFATSISGILASSWWGWPSVFYFNATIALIWSVLMIIFGYQKPEEHPSISQSELEYIKKGKHFTKKRIPWSNILKSTPTWAAWVAHVSVIWTTRLCTTEFPTYINRALGFDVETGSNVLALTYLIAYFNTFLVSSVSQYLINKHYLSVVASRKICNSIASWGASFFLILLGTFTINRYATLVLIFLIFMCANAGFSGYNLNYNDLTPNYSACLLGVGGLSSTVISFIPVTLVQFMVPNQEDNAEWGNAFWLAAIVMSSGNAFFVWKARGDIQDWDDIESEGNSPIWGSYMDIDGESNYGLEKSK